ncbi:SPOR domain-containing protein [Phaeovulum sp. W22_SRMD_FR3]|uniref:SPOR domain-containing protein n=1 Tax=Phaeovulum sp. W22_SRMD_FR3 TaxID=3240274 RepID=UPI003F9D51F0
MAGFNPRENGDDGYGAETRRGPSGHAQYPAYDVPGDDVDAGPPRVAVASKWVTYAGAATSVALILGLAVWGYKLAVRDVNGVPVIRALEGPGRMAPEDPGGDLARHVGLSVNAVAAEGVAAPAPDQVMLAPRADELTDEDMPMAGVGAITAPDSVPSRDSSTRETVSQVPGELPVPDNVRKAQLAAAEKARAEALARAAEMAAKPAAPAVVDERFDPTVENPAEAEAGPGATATAPEIAAVGTPGAAEAPVVEETGSDEAASTPIIAADVPGVSVSPRPLPKPEGDLMAQAAVDAVTAALAPAPAVDLSPADVPAGTRLVQLGAFDDTEAAHREWDRVVERFDALMAGKRRVVEEAVSGGRTFFRLRVEGFEDLSDSRRFCAALVAEGQNCIPATARK